MSSTSVASKMSPAGPPGHAERRHPKPRRAGTPWRQTCEFTAVTTIAETLLGLVIALALFKTFRGRGLVRAAVLVPWAIPTVVTARMFSWLFDQGGLVNYLLVTTHLVAQPVNFLGSTTLALPTLMAADVWKTTPFMALLLLAGLQTIPPDLAEAARIDGASAWTYFRRVRLPLLMPPCWWRACCGRLTRSGSS